MTGDRARSDNPPARSGERDAPEPRRGETAPGSPTRRLPHRLPYYPDREDQLQLLSPWTFETWTGSIEEGKHAVEEGAGQYLDLLKRILTNQIYQDAPIPTAWSPLARYDKQRRTTGEDWPSVAHTMVGRARLDNVQQCIEQVLADDVPGDFIEAGVWRGGVCILMRAILADRGIVDRTVWVADSFAGIPETTPGSHPADAKLRLHQHNNVLAIGLEQVKENFRRYGLLDKQVEFLRGWFCDTLPTAPIEQLAVLRLDGDLYESTMDCLVNLYDKLSVGGFVIVDDYWQIEACRAAVTEFREQRSIHDEMMVVDKSCVYWRKTD
jgi:hypothetical protein